METLTPIRFEGYMQSGGSTRPWRVVAVHDNAEEWEEVAYVVKTFTINNVEQAHSVGKEFICNALAGQFDLDAPEACMINLNDEDFKSTLDEGPLKVLASKFKGITYASRLLSNASIINEDVRGNSFDIDDCATLFAFDCLIINLDRGGHRNKPNLLVDDEGFFLIDHELTFPFLDAPNTNGLDIIFKNFNENTWLHFYEKHLFYTRLKTYRGTKRNLFDTFEESLRTLNINYIQQVINDLGNNNISLGNSELLIKYLSSLKQNAHKFRNILQGLIA